VRRLNTINGISIPADAIRSRPAFNMSVLAGAVKLLQFQAAVETAITRIQTTLPAV
jgi:hypothetical protein